MPGLGASGRRSSAQRVGVEIGVVRASVGALLSDLSRRREKLACQELDAGSTRADDGDLRPAGEVLAEVVDGKIRFWVSDLDWLEGLEGLNRRSGVMDEYAAGACNRYGPRPSRVVEMGHVSPGRFKPGIEVLTAIGVRKSDWAGDVFQL